MKSIKSCYNLLDLPYDATENDVLIKQKVLVRLYRVKSIKDNKPSNNKIQEIDQAASLLIAHIRENGTSAEETNHRETLKNELYILLIATLITFALAFIIL